MPAAVREDEGLAILVKNKIVNRDHNGGNAAYFKQEVLSYETVLLPRYLSDKR
jgi:hypothetical protein